MTIHTYIHTYILHTSVKHGHKRGGGVRVYWIPSDRSSCYFRSSNPFNRIEIIFLVAQGNCLRRQDRPISAASMSAGTLRRSIVLSDTAPNLTLSSKRSRAGNILCSTPPSRYNSRRLFARQGGKGKRLKSYVAHDVDVVPRRRLDRQKTAPTVSGMGHNSVLRCLSDGLL